MNIKQLIEEMNLARVNRTDGDITQWLIQASKLGYRIKLVKNKYVAVKIND
jgi:hypothetical protein